MPDRSAIVFGGLDLSAGQQAVGDHAPHQRDQLGLGGSTHTRR